MVVDVTVPKWGLTMKEAEIVKWYKNEGERVEKGEPLVQVMTEKITNDIEAPASGILKTIMKKKGDSAEVAEKIAEIETNE
ncbi:biotin attachment protein [Petrotoga mexicana DSM 14811]|uniref:Biotin attachment protein n=1 Tax=Petrotoga mexicana DSM 14811 TaxID=1122954 RepID=A0A2K1P9G4_9BACT|nr:lipoyl domain-containing protein [Petrotoga mexicana]PNR99431.1 biotin attachment protein [Petrotoga mexicana DSM 14811]